MQKSFRAKYSQLPLLDWSQLDEAFRVYSRVLPFGRDLSLSGHRKIPPHFARRNSPCNSIGLPFGIMKVNSTTCLFASIIVNIMRFSNPPFVLPATSRKLNSIVFPSGDIFPSQRT